MEIRRLSSNVTTGDVLGIPHVHLLHQPVSHRLDLFLLSNGFKQTIYILFVPRLSPLNMGPASGKKRPTPGAIYTRGQRCEASEAPDAI